MKKSNKQKLTPLPTEKQSKKTIVVTVLITLATVTVVGAIGYAGFRIGVNHERNTQKTVDARVTQVVSRVK